jgi:hypothetical protein
MTYVMPASDHTERNYWIAGCYRAIQATVGRQLQNQYEVPKELPHQLLAILAQLAEHPAQGRGNQKSLGKTRRQAGSNCWAPTVEVGCPLCGRPMTYLHTIRRAFADDLIVLKCNPCGFSTTEFDAK